MTTPINRFLAESKEIQDRAHTELNSLCQCATRFRMTIPPQPGDSDLVLQEPINFCETQSEMIKIAVEALGEAIRSNESAIKSVVLGFIDLSKEDLVDSQKIIREALAAINSLAEKAMK